MQVSWASAVEKLASKTSADKPQFKEMLDEIKAREIDGKPFHEDFLPALKNLITKKMQSLGPYCGITAGLHSNNKHNLVFYCLRSHLNTKLAREQIKFLVGIKR